MDSSVIITGGYERSLSNRVTEYNEAGHVRDLPSLNQERSNHGCSYYDNSEGTKVNKCLDVVSVVSFNSRRSSFLVAELATPDLVAGRALLSYWWRLRQPGSMPESFHLLAMVSVG